MLRLKFTPVRIFVFLVFIALLAGASISFIPKKTKAFVASFYPKSCLGGWNNVHGAEGKPDVDADNNPGVGFNESDSAYVTDSIADIFCGQFDGEIPKDSAPTNFVLKLSWKFGSPDATTTVSTTPDPAVVQMNEAIQDFAASGTAATSSDVSPSPSDTPDASPEDSTSVAPDTPPDTTPVDTPIPTQTDTPTPDVPTDTPAPAPQQSFLFQLVPKVLADDEIASTTPAIADASSTATTTDATLTPFLSIDYTLDGAAWKHLAFVTSVNMLSSFKFPAEDVASWGDVSNLQVRVSRLATLDQEPEVLLDAMTIQADYAPVAPPKSGNSDTKKFHVTGIVTALPIGVSVTTDPDQGELFSLGSLTPGIFHFYSLTDPTYSMITAIGDGQLIIPAYQFFVGDFEAILTGRPDGCDGLTLDECKADPQYIGHVLFSIVPSDSATSTIQ